MTVEPFWTVGGTALYHGDSIDVLRTLPSESVQTCVTSPPYWGLRDYGTEGQLGLEATPEEYVTKMVDVFREVRRCLRDDGTLWLNLGDSYAAQRGGTTPPANVSAGGVNGWTGDGERTNRGRKDGYNPSRNASAIGLKHKDLVGIPWAVAKALRDPYYTGKVKAERDRVWMAATLDAEGTICGFRHERADGSGVRTGINVTITNTSTAMLDECHRIWPASRAEHENHGEGHLGGRPSWRWVCNGMENRMLLLRELYPYLITKRIQAVLAYNLLAFMVDAKRLGKTPEAGPIHEKREMLVRLLSEANQTGDAGVPSWCVEPPSMFEPGWYLRSDIIWHKPNPMPESVTDRPTKSHEYLFLLSKSPRYYYDAGAIREQSVGQTLHDVTGQGYSPPGQTPSGGNRKTDKQRGHGRRHAGFSDRWDGMTKEEQGALGRNKRGVWTIATAPFPKAHFATFPPKLVEPCILAGSKPGDVVLDPFLGSGTTAMVAKRLGRKSIGIDLNADYLSMATERIGTQLGLAI